MHPSPPTAAPTPEIERLPIPWFHGLCAGLILLYVNTFEIWTALTDHLGRERASLIPFAAVLAAFGLFALAARRAWRGGRLCRGMVVLGLVLAGVALALPEAQFPAKRIHVAQYMLVAVVVRYGLRRSLGGAALTVAGVAITALYGAHDEMIQGLHPARTFGLEDWLVDILAGAAGSLLAHGIGLFEARGPAVTGLRRLAREVPPGLTVILAGVVALMVPLPAFRDDLAPWWTVLPLLAGGVVWFALPPPADPALRAVTEQIAVLGLLLALYPGLLHALPLTFR